MKGQNSRYKGLSTDKPRDALTRMTRIKIRLCNLSNRIKSHLSHTGVMAVLCITAEGFYNECFGITMIKNILSSLIFVWVSHLQLLNPPMSACLLSRKAAWYKSNINQETPAEGTQRREIFVTHDERSLTGAFGANFYNSTDGSI